MTQSLCVTLGIWPNGLFQCSLCDWRAWQVTLSVLRCGLMKLSRLFRDKTCKLKKILRSLIQSWKMFCTRIGTVKQLTIWSKLSILHLEMQTFSARSPLPKFGRGLGRLPLQNWEQVVEKGKLILVIYVYELGGLIDVFYKPLHHNIKKITIHRNHFIRKGKSRFGCDPDWRTSGVSSKMWPRIVFSRRVLIDGG